MLEMKKIALTLSEGMLASVTNLLLFSIFWVGSSVGKNGSRGAALAFEEAFGTLEEINYSSIKRALFRLKKRDLVAIAKKDDIAGPVSVRITAKGKTHLQRLLSAYRKNRPHEGSLFMVTYDIPERQRKARDHLRFFLKRIGCVKLQRSVWLSVYNPQEKIYAFVAEHKISGTVIISNFGEDGTIGEIDVKSLLARLFKLERLNAEYREVIKQIKKVKKLSPSDYFTYHAVLKKDPQLPQKLLPEDWVGDKAHKLIVNKLRSQ